MHSKQIDYDVKLPNEVMEPAIRAKEETCENVALHRAETWTLKKEDRRHEKCGHEDEQKVQAMKRRVEEKHNLLNNIKQEVGFGWTYCQKRQSSYNVSMLSGLNTEVNYKDQKELKIVTVGVCDHGQHTKRTGPEPATMQKIIYAAFSQNIIVLLNNVTF